MTAAYLCSGTSYHLPACGGTCGEIDDAPAATKREGTLTALYEDGEQVTFTDYVFEGQVVDVFRTFEEAEVGRGYARSMRVRRDGDVWWLEAV